jgi:hypothetical protein
MMCRGPLIMGAGPAACGGWAMIDLLISAEAENVEKLGVPADHTFFIKLRCVNCNDISPSAVGISRDMEVEGIRGASVNMQVR